MKFFTKKILIFFLITSILDAQDSENPIGLSFVPNIIEGKTVLTEEKILSDRSSFLGSGILASIVKQSSFDQNNNLVESQYAMRLFAWSNQGAFSVLLSNEEVLELKKGLSILNEKYNQARIERKPMIVTYSLYRNPNDSNLVSYSSIKKFDSEEMGFVDEVTFYKYNEEVCEIYFNYSVNKVSWFFGGIKLKKSQLEFAINKLLEENINDF